MLCIFEVFNFTRFRSRMIIDVKSRSRLDPRSIRHSRKWGPGRVPVPVLFRFTVVHAPSAGIRDPRCITAASFPHVEICRPAPQHRTRASPTHDFQTPRCWRNRCLSPRMYCPQPADHRCKLPSSVPPPACVTAAADRLVAGGHRCVGCAQQTVAAAIEVCVEHGVAHLHVGD